MEVKMVSMKRSESDKRKDMGAPAPIESVGPDYPWGLTLHLDKDELKKLGMKELPKVGTIFPMQVSVTVTRTTESAAAPEYGGEDQQCVDLQITDIGIG